MKEAGKMKKRKRLDTRCEDPLGLKTLKAGLAGKKKLSKVC